MPRINSSAELEEFRKNIISQRDPNKPCITLCSGSACHASGSGKVATSLEEEIKKQGLGNDVNIRKTGCHGFCERGPIIVIHPEEICYLQIEPGDVPEIFSRTIKKNEIIERLLYVDPSTKKKIVYESENSGPRGFNRIHRIGFTESVRVELDAELGCQVARISRRVQSNG